MKLLGDSSDEEEKVVPTKKGDKKNKDKKAGKESKTDKKAEKKPEKVEKKATEKKAEKKVEKEVKANPIVETESETDEAEDEEQELQINTKFAEQFERSARQKELARNKSLIDAGLLDEDDDDSSEESEDDDAELLSPELDLQIIQTINSLRKKDPKIYDRETKWCKVEENEEGGGRDGEKSKKKRYKDILREQLLRDGADIDSDDENVKGLTEREMGKDRKGFAYDREQEEIRKAFLKAAKTDGEEDDEEDESESDSDGLLAVKNKSAEEKAKEEEEIQRALQEMESLAKPEKETEKEAEEFLTNFLKKKLWKEKEFKKVPGKSNKYDSESDGVDTEEDEKEIEASELFESKYNFRFEEMEAEKERLLREGGGRLNNVIGVGINLGLGKGAPGIGSAYQVVGHSRNVEGSLRREDDKRKLQREQRKERKEKEKRQREEELKRLKNLKKQEVSEFYCLGISTVTHCMSYCSSIRSFKIVSRKSTNLPELRRKKVSSSMNRHWMTIGILRNTKH